jgi:hypothetical protein
MAMIAQAEKFLAKHLGGRFQEGATPEVTARLKEITVDVKTVEMPKRVDAGAMATARPASDLRPSLSNYQGKLELGAQAIAFTLAVEIKEENGAWKASETAKLPGGELSDITVLEKGSLVVTKRLVKQGPTTMDIAIKGDQASGSVVMGEKSTPVAFATGGAVFADGAGAYDVIATLPLADGYSAVFRNADLQKQKTDLKQVKVTGVEKVTVPAGTFESFKCEITSTSGEPGKTTVWIAKDGRKVVKVSAVLPQLNGAVMTSELVK